MRSLVAHVAEEPDPIPRHRVRIRRHFRRRGHPACEQQGRRPGHLLPQGVIGPDERPDVLARLDRADMKDGARGGRLLADPPGRRAGVADGDALGRDPEAPFELAGGVVGDGDDGVGASGMGGRQRGIVPPDLAGRRFRVVQEVEIVGRHDPGGVPRRHEQGMERPGDLGVDAECLDGRPAQTVPGVVQDPDRDVQVQPVGARQDGTARDGPSRSSRTASRPARRAAAAGPPRAGGRTPPRRCAHAGQAGSREGSANARMVPQRSAAGGAAANRHKCFTLNRLTPFLWLC